MENNNQQELVKSEPKYQMLNITKITNMNSDTKRTHDKPTKQLFP